MSAFPTVKVELAFGSGFTDTAASRTWTDVTSYVSGVDGIGITYGRSDEQQQPSPNTLSLTFENVLGDFTPGYASSTFYPNVVKGVPIRVTFTYTGASVRYVGYVNEWPVQWPTGSNLFATTTITAASRRARLGQTAPFAQAAIVRAYLATTPEAYWTMDEDTNVIDTSGRQVFRDVTNQYIAGSMETEFIGAFANTDALAPIVRDGTTGPTDMNSLVHFPKFTDSSFIGNNVHYVGGGARFSIPGGAGVTVELLLRMSAYTGDTNRVTLLSLMSADQSQQLVLLGGDTRAVGGSALIGANIVVIDTASRTVLDSESGGADVWDTAVDGKLHHLAMTLASGGVNATVYFDGVNIGTFSMSTAVSARLTQIAIGTDTYYTDAWLGHAAVHTRALTSAEMLTRAKAAIAADETISARMIRIAGYLGVPTAEISAETSIAAPLGPQTELSQTGASILDAVATSTNGVLYDARDGTLTMQARNHRYNATSVVTLGTSGEEIEADLTLAYDDRYLINTVEVSRQGSEQSAALTLSDTTSVDQYGVYDPGAFTLVTSLDSEAESFGADLLYRYAQPKVRVSAVTVDVNDLSSAQRTLVLSLDIGSKITLTGLPVQAGASSMDLFIEGYSESYSTTGKHMITFNTTPASGYPHMSLVGTDVVGAAATVVY